jgi:hypothetical protein
MSMDEPRYRPTNRDVILQDCIDGNLPLAYMSWLSNTQREDRTYRISIEEINVSGWYVLVMNCLDKDLDDLYVNINALPDWVKNKLALLQMIDVGEGLDDTGRHIAKNVFWVQN